MKPLVKNQSSPLWVENHQHKTKFFTKPVCQKLSKRFMLFWLSTIKTIKSALRPILPNEGFGCIDYA